MAGDVAGGRVHRLPDQTDMVIDPVDTGQASAACIDCVARRTIRIELFRGRLPQ